MAKAEWIDAGGLWKPRAGGSGACLGSGPVPILIRAGLRLPEGARWVLMRNDSNAESAPPYRLQIAVGGDEEGGGNSGGRSRDSDPFD